MEDQSILEPLKEFQNRYQKAFHEEAEKYLDELVKKSAVNIEENKKTIQAYKKANEELTNLQKKQSTIKFWKTISLIFAIGFAVVTLISTYNVFIQDEKGIPLLVAIVSLILSASLFLLSFLYLKKKIKKLEEECAKLSDKVTKLRMEAEAQMKPLNDLFDWNTPNRLINRTTPLIQMDEYFDVRKLDYLTSKFGFKEESDKNVSTHFLLSGSIVGNPFLVKRDYTCEMLPKRYEGHKTIHWTEYGRDSKGNRVVHHRSQVLTAYVTQPAPVYHFDTNLIYGSEAAPDLSFLRHPSGLKGMTEKEIDKKIKKDNKLFDKKERKAVESGTVSSYTKIDNVEFESLFGADNRDNEVQFRLLFTPLAQKNFQDLIRNQKPYGDDFSFEKKKKINLIASDHGNRQDISTDPKIYRSFDFEEIKKSFLDYNDTFFASLYFDLAPILSIPLYQQHKTKEYLYQEDYGRNYTNFEAESIANGFDAKVFAPNQAQTPSILKSTFVERNGKTDQLSIQANAYRTERRVTYISKHGGDGRTHTIPVEWDEYIPVHKETLMAMRYLPVSENDYHNQISTNRNFVDLTKKSQSAIFKRGFIAFCISQMLTKTDDTVFDQFTNKEN